MKSLQYTLAACLLVITPALHAESTNASQPGAESSTNDALTDAQFVEKAGMGGMLEVESSKLAATNAENADVKSFAQSMLTDHGKANEELKKLAAGKNLMVPAALDSKHSEKLNKLTGKKGEEFDKAYGKLQAKAHKQAVALFEKAATSLTDADLKAFASKTLPTLKEHMEKASKLPGANEADKM
jgi:putative membrane protein